ncbi:MAG: ribonuclease E inhibitor RraB [bacterium]|nr:ribonuclease E inhibitor RraB [bacterium]
MTAFPNDENGDVLRRMLASGDDLTRAREIEFVHVMPNESAAHAMAKAAGELGYSASAFCDEESGDWEVVCFVEMVPTHEGITKFEADLAELASRFGGRADGWGCFESE